MENKTRFKLALQQVKAAERRLERALKHLVHEKEGTEIVRVMLSIRDIEDDLEKQIRNSEKPAGK